MNSVLSLSALLALLSVILVMHDQELYKRLTAEILVQHASQEYLQVSLERYARYYAQTKPITFPHTLSLTYPVKAKLYFQSFGEVTRCLIHCGRKRWEIDWVSA